MVADAGHQITDLLEAWTNGSAEARDRLVEELYPRLRRLASRLLSREPGDISLQATELVNMAFLRLIDQRAIRWQNRNHFFAISARVIRRVLLDHYRKKRSRKRGGDVVKVSLEGLPELAGASHPDLLQLNRALDRLERVDPIAVQVIELRYFAGLSQEETAQVLELGRATVVRKWRYARAWLRAAIAEDAS